MAGNEQTRCPCSQSSDRPDVSINTAFNSGHCTSCTNVHEDAGWDESYLNRNTCEVKVLDSAAFFVAVHVGSVIWCAVLVGIPRRPQHDLLCPCPARWQVCLLIKA